jgi:hypothetical protein
VGGAGHRISGPHGRRYAGSFTGAAGRRRNKAGWDLVHIAIDDATRLAYAEVLADEKATTAIAFLGRAIEFFARHGMTVRELLTDNGSPYRSAVHAIAPRAGHPPPAHPPPPPTNQREGRTLHPHHARRLGLRRDLRLKRGTHRSP